MGVAAHGPPIVFHAEEFYAALDKMLVTLCTMSGTGRSYLVMAALSGDDEVLRRV